MVKLNRIFLIMIMFLFSLSALAQEEPEDPCLMDPEMCNPPEDMPEDTSQVVCGNNICDTGESYDTCPMDCSREEQQDTICIEDWQCKAWSDCIENQKTRSCTDLNNCGTTNNKPEETKSCSLKKKTEEANETIKHETETTTKEHNIIKPVKKEASESGFFSGLLIRIILAISIVGIIAFFLYRNAKKEQGGVIIEQENKEVKPESSTKESIIYNQEKVETKKIEEPKTMPSEEIKINPKLIGYIRINIRKGFTKEQIKKALLKSGWDGKEVSLALSKF